MKTSLSAYELGFIVKEIQGLVSGKVVKVYQPEDSKITLQIHLPNQGKRFLHIFLPGFLFLSETKLESPETPPGFCMFLRKHLENNRITAIEQKGFERIVEIRMESKEKKKIILIELFSNGNLILCDESYLIHGLHKPIKTKERDIKAGATYEFPKQFHDLHKLADITKAINGSARENISTTLAMDLGLGGVFSQEVCKVCGFDQQKKIPAYGIIKVFEAIQEILMRKPEPTVVYEEGIIDVVPTRFLIYEGRNQHATKSFSEGIERLAMTAAVQQGEQKQEKQKEAKMQKVMKLLENQQKQLQSIEDAVKSNTEKAEALYQHYQVVYDVLTEINKARETHGWQEIKARLKGHAVVKEIDPKEKKVVIEIE